MATCWHKAHCINPQPTRHDYNALLNETGDPMDKYFFNKKFKIGKAIHSKLDLVEREAVKSKMWGYFLVSCTVVTCYHKVHCIDPQLISCDCDARLNEAGDPTDRYSHNPNKPTAKNYYSNQHICEGTWDWIRWCHAINPHIPMELLRLRRQSSVACIYLTHGWDARGPLQDIMTSVPPYVSFHSSFPSFPHKDT